MGLIRKIISGFRKRKGRAKIPELNKVKKLVNEQIYVVDEKAIKSLLMSFVPKKKDANLLFDFYVGCRYMAALDFEKFIHELMKKYKYKDKNKFIKKVSEILYDFMHAINETKREVENKDLNLSIKFNAKIQTAANEIYAKIHSFFYYYKILTEFLGKKKVEKFIEEVKNKSEEEKLKTILFKILSKESAKLLWDFYQKVIRRKQKPEKFAAEYGFENKKLLLNEIELNINFVKDVLAHVTNRLDEPLKSEWLNTTKPFREFHIDFLSLE